MVGRLVLTGAAGAVATSIRPLLRREGREVVLVDLVEVVDPADGLERALVLDVTDLDAVRRAVAGAQAVVHLAGYHSERPWEAMQHANITGPRTVLEACRQEGVHNVLLASSVHVVGMRTVAEVRDTVEPSPEPDTYYGVAKAAAEALGRLYASRFGMAVVVARMGTAEPEPSSARALSTWLSPTDFVRLIEATAGLREPGGHVVWAVSANTRRWVDLRAGAAIGFVPRDDAEPWAPALGDPAPFPDDTRLGGAFTDDQHPVGVTW